MNSLLKDQRPPDPLNSRQRNRVAVLRQQRGIGIATPAGNSPGIARSGDAYGRVPSQLKELQIWLPFRTSPRPSGGVNKIPYNRHGRKAKYTDPAEWMSFDDALKQMHKGGYAGLGIVVSKEMGLLAIDFDHCISNGALDGSVERHVAGLNTYTEISFSGDGLHAIAYAALPWKANRRENSCVEMYDDRRFFVVTGKHLQGSPDEIVENQTAVDRLHLQVFGQQ